MTVLAAWTITTFLVIAFGLLYAKHRLLLAHWRGWVHFTDRIIEDVSDHERRQQLRTEMRRMLLAQIADWTKGEPHRD